MLTTLFHTATVFCHFAGRATLLLGMACLGLACRDAKTPAAAPSTNAVAVVAGAEISVPMLQAELARQFQSAPAPTLAQKQAALETLIQTEALYAKAQAAGFDQTPEMAARIKQLIVTQFREAQFPAASPLPTDQEVEQYYRKNKDRYALPAKVRGAVIFLATPANATLEKQLEFGQRAEAVWAEAQAAQSDVEFADVVRRHSEDQASRYRGGDIGWLNPGDARNPALTEALFAVEKPGQVAPLIRTSRGFFIAKVLERTEAGFQPLAEVREAIRYQLTRQQAQQAEAEFRAATTHGLSIAINQPLLESVTVPDKKVSPPRTPGARTAQISP
jgi:parvulin-like peptidyl-prolyl isomerase